MLRYRLLFAVFFCSLVLSPLLRAQGSAAPMNTDPTYRALRDIRLSDETVVLENVTVKREFATFTFRTGTMFFLAPVAGKITGAVFVGEGTLLVNPTLETEKRSLMLLAKAPALNESFNVAVLRFTDGTHEELVKAASPAKQAPERSTAAKALAENLDLLQHDRIMRYNLSARILQDLLSSGPGGFFAAFIHGKISDREVFVVDPQGANMFGLEPEEVAFATADQERFGIWAAGHLASEYAAGTAKGTQMNAPIDVLKQKLDVSVNRSGYLRGTAITTFAAVRPGMRVAPFTLFRNFHVDSVTDSSGAPLGFILEHASFLRGEEDDEGNFSVILPRPLAAGEQFTIKTVYGGKEAVQNEGNGNYYPVARQDWFPYNRTGDYSDFDITLRVPKGLQVVATGSPVREVTEGDQFVSEWKTDAPIHMAGFHFGKFKRLEDKLKNGFLLLSYANEEQPGWVVALRQNAAPVGWAPFNNGAQAAPEVALGQMDTTTMMKRPLAEAELALQLYSNYFGSIPYKQLAITQQTACNYGQSWPGLVWVPICSFFDASVKHQLGLDDPGQPYWSVVVPHETAHQWWGQTVGWASYRDQWISEGFANESASIFIHAFYQKDPSLFQRFWREAERSLEMSNRWGLRPIDVGPVTMGVRLNGTRIGDNYTPIVYGKGAFIIHMLHLMMLDPKTGDQPFREMMRDFVTTFQNRPASTEDFKAVAEKHMTPSMDLDHNHRLDWFFDEYVYGTELPKYDFSYTIEQGAGGVVLDMKLTQSKVSPGFRMLVPVYGEMANGAVVRLGAATLVGNATIQQKIPLGKVAAPKKLMINYYYDVLSAR